MDGSSKTSHREKVRAQVFVIKCDGAAWEAVWRNVMSHKVNMEISQAKSEYMKKFKQEYLHGKSQFFSGVFFYLEHPVYIYNYVAYPVINITLYSHFVHTISKIVYYIKIVKWLSMWDLTNYCTHFIMR